MAMPRKYHSAATPPMARAMPPSNFAPQDAGTALLASVWLNGPGEAGPTGQTP